MEIDPTVLSVAERYKLLTGGIIPRPVALVSTVSVDGRSNLAPYSFYNGICSNPMSLLFCPINDADGSMKDTLRNALPQAEGGTGQFVVNVASEAYAGSIRLAGATVQGVECEFATTGLTPVQGTRVRAHRVIEAPLAYECETLQVIRLGIGIPAGGNIVVGRVVMVHVHEDLVNERYHVDREVLGAVGLVGDKMFCRTRGEFDLL
jgi:flavin reductase (DIM6/NTAB) family NADH-FMN oxidoreductase RutF